MGNEVSISKRNASHVCWRSIWKEGSSLLESAVLDVLIACKIFSTGKSLNFIRYSCHDSDWVVTREKMSNTGGSECAVKDPEISLTDPRQL